VCTLHQTKLEVKKLSVSYSDTSAKLQDLKIVLGDNTLLAELELNVKISELNLSSVIATTRKGRSWCCNFGKKWIIMIDRTHLVTTQTGVKWMIH
jgi:hypothetical protein